MANRKSVRANRFAVLLRIGIREGIRGNERTHRTCKNDHRKSEVEHFCRVKEVEGGGHSFTVFRKKMKLDQMWRKEEDEDRKSVV